MGNCTSHNKEKSNSKYNSSAKIQFPDMIYLDSKSKSIISIRSKDSFRLNLKKRVRVYKDSSISLLEDNSLIICGGSDSSGSLTSGIYQIHLNENLLKLYPNLPIPCKHGTFLSSQSYFYYIGGICESQDPDSITLEEAAPLCRLNKHTLKWNVYICKPEFNPTKFLQRKICTEENTEQVSINNSSGIKLKDLLEPGAAIFDNRIYLFGGKISNTVAVPTNKIFSICLQENNFSINEELVSLPVALFAPSCVMKRNLAIIAGGFLIDLSVNLEVFLVDCTHGVMRKFDMAFDRPIEPRFPIVTDGKGIACVAPDKILYIREDKTNVFLLSIPNDIESRKLKYLVNETTNDCEVEKKVVNLRINFITEWQAGLHDNDKNSNELAQMDNHSKYRDKTFEGCEESQVLNTSKSKSPVKVKVFNCECGSLISSNRLDELNLICGHCGISKEKLYKCQDCQKILCKICAKNLQTSKAFINESIKCRNNHWFCDGKSDSVETAQPCCNCSKAISKEFYFCFICQILLCIDCENLINQQTCSESLKCSLDHTLKWVLVCSSSSPSSICDTCLEQIKQIGYFYCTTCRYSLCFTCVRLRQETAPENNYFSKANTYQERPKKISDTLYKNEFNYGDEPFMYRQKVSRSRKSFSKIIAKAHKVEITESETGNDTPGIRKFETSYNTIKKKAIPKPIRSKNPPLFPLSLKQGVKEPNQKFVALESKRLSNSSEGSLNNELQEHLVPPLQNPFSKKIANGKSCLQAKASDSNRKVLSVKGAEVLNSSKGSLEVSECVNPLDIQDASYVCHNQSFSHLTSQTSYAPNLNNVPELISQYNLEVESQFRSASGLIAGQDSSIGSLENNKDSHALFVSNIQGTLAASKVITLKVKLNLLISMNDGFSSSSESESFEEIVFRPFEDLPSSQFNTSEALSESQSFTNREVENKRYKNLRESFSIESSKSDERKD